MSVVSCCLVIFRFFLAPRGFVSVKTVRFVVYDSSPELLPCSAANFQRAIDEKQNGLVFSGSSEVFLNAAISPPAFVFAHE